uniref:Kunitz-type protease inhibitor 1-like protein n=1 Tax=Pseudodiaptomus poplesia TaxID=213370 RepID=A0A0U2V949_9MAXI|nr:kunitz-type protease inhibitor 1-like protein [Pseudodiaptomus poplesia]
MKARTVRMFYVMLFCFTQFLSTRVGAVDPACQEPPTETGSCRALIPITVFKNGQCVKVIWGGCEETKNKFESMADCKEKCLK